MSPIRTADLMDCTPGQRVRLHFQARTTGSRRAARIWLRQLETQLCRDGHRARYRAGIFVHGRSCGLDIDLVPLTATTAISSAVLASVAARLRVAMTETDVVDPDGDDARWRAVVAACDVRAATRLAWWLGTPTPASYRRLAEQPPGGAAGRPPCHLTHVTGLNVRADDLIEAFAPITSGAAPSPRGARAPKTSELSGGEQGLLHCHARLSIVDINRDGLAALLVWNAALLGPYDSVAYRRLRSGAALTYVWDSRVELADRTGMMVAEIEAWALPEFVTMVREILDSHPEDRLTRARLVSAKAACRAQLIDGWLDGERAVTFEADLNLAGIPSVCADAASRAALLADIDMVTIADLSRVATLVSRHYVGLTTFTGIT